MTMMATCYNLKRLVYFQKAGIEVFWGEWYRMANQSG
jgi:hypothetical protein